MAGFPELRYPSHLESFGCFATVEIRPHLHLRISLSLININSKMLLNNIDNFIKFLLRIFLLPECEFPGTLISI